MARPAMEATEPSPDSREATYILNGGKLRELRTKRFGSIRNFATFLGITENAAARYELGLSTPFADRLMEMCAALACEPGDIMSEVE